MIKVLLFLIGAINCLSIPNDIEFPNNWGVQYIPDHEYDASKFNYIECFPYMGEDDVLRLKMQITDSVVDYFVITEGLYTHTGIEKELRFNIENFPEFRHKIIYMPLRDMPFVRENAKTRFDYWENEYYMRNQAINAIKRIADENTIIISDDLDEILRPESIL